MKLKLSLLACLFMSFALAQQNTGDWVSLFNGKDLTGFKQLNGKAPYKVVKGEIVGTTKFGEPKNWLVFDYPSH